MQLWPGWVHLQGFAVEVGAVENDDRLFSLGIGLHLNESEASGQAGPAIRHHLGPLDCAVRLKKGSNVPFGNVWIEIPNEDVVHRDGSFYRAEALSCGSSGLTFLFRSNSLSLRAAKR